MKVTAKDIELLREIDEYRGATRTWNGRVHTWLVNHEARTRGVHRLIKLGLLWTHFPVGGGDAGLTDEARELIKERG